MSADEACGENKAHAWCLSDRRGDFGQFSRAFSWNQCFLAKLVKRNYCWISRGQNSLQIITLSSMVVTFSLYPTFSLKAFKNDNSLIIIN